MALYAYIKEEPSLRRRVLTTISYGSMLAGSLFLFWSFYPVIAFEIYSNIFIENRLSSPLSSSQAAASEKRDSVLGTRGAFSTNLTDFTKAAVWFPQAEATTEDSLLRQKPVMKDYLLSIPEISIENMRVQINGDDLLKGLVHFQSSTLVLPGEPGNIPIFGHSTLPALHKKGDYKSAFTYLPTLDKGDLIYLIANDVKYTYRVYDKFVVKPYQVSVLQQSYDDSYLTLVTCVPLGTYWNRLVVKAKLTHLQ